MSSTKDQRVVVVTGGAAGIGAAIATELGRGGAHVVTLDPMVTLDGATKVGGSEPTTAERIVAAGGSAQAAAISVTDRSGVDGLFEELVAERGAIDAVVNVAGISRPTEFASGSEEDWAAVVGVHLQGYLTILGAALPRMAAAGHGRVLAITSGSGWRKANAGAYGAAKRAVAALTWQLGAAAPTGVTINALSPIAETRMVRESRERARAMASPTDRDGKKKSGGISLAAPPPPEELGPLAAYLASEEFSWSTGQMLFSSGSEAAVVHSPRLLEVCDTARATSLPVLVDAVLGGAFGRVEKYQSTTGAMIARFTDAYHESTAPAPFDPAPRCIVVTDDAIWGAEVSAALHRRGVTCIGLAGTGQPITSDDLPTDFPRTTGAIASAAGSEPLDAVVVALKPGTSATDSTGTEWGRILAAHDGLPDKICLDAAWGGAVADHALATKQPVRLVSLVQATTPGGNSRAQAATQHARSAQAGTDELVDAFVVAVESAELSARQTAAELAAHLVGAPDAKGLAGAELVANDGWFGLSSHPAPSTAFSLGSAELPGWFDTVLRRALG